MASEISEEKTLKFEGADEDENKILRYTYNSRQEAYEAKRQRMYDNRINFDTFNLRSDTTHKKKGQSKEFIPKQRMAVQQLSSFISQTIIDAGQWFSVVERPGIKDPLIKAHEIKLLLNWGLEKQNFPSFIDESLKLGILGSLMVCKIHGEWKDSYDYEVENEVDEKGRMARNLYKNSKKSWYPKLSLVRQEDAFPDPTGQGLFDIYQMEVDLHTIKGMAEGPNAIYDQAATDKIVGGFEDVEQEARKARETSQLTTFHTSRKRCRIWECYGDILDPVTGDVMMKNAMWTVCNDRFLIQKPIPNPYWHGELPAVSAPILRVPFSVWHGSLADSMSQLNLAMNEMFNLQLDSGLMATWGIRQLRPGWLADDTKYADGIAPGETLEVNEACPPGAKVLEPVQTSEMTPEANAVYQQISSEFQQAAMTNDLRMGTIPGRDVKATEVVEANQTIGSMLGAIGKAIENDYLMQILRKMWMTIAQHLKDIDEDELVSMFGQDRVNELLAMGAEEIFASTVKGVRFKVYGISESLSKMKDFRKMTALLQTIGANEVMMEAFIKKYDFTKVMEKIMTSLDIDLEEIQHDEADIAAMSGQPLMGPGAGQPGHGPSMQSQTPQVASANMAQTGNGIAQPAQMQKTAQYANATVRGNQH